MVKERLQKILTRSGDYTAYVQDVPYHSPYDPAREAQRFCASFRIEEAATVLLYGWGLGYCGRLVAAQARRSARILVFEPDAELFALSRGEAANAQLFQDSRFQFVVGASACRVFDDWGFADCQETDQFLWIEWPSAVRDAAQAELAGALKLRFKTRLRDRAANLLTHFRNGESYFAQALANLRYQDAADVGNLFGQFRRVPLAIVSAGPSLDRNIEQLRAAQDNLFILAVDTALRPLTAAGIEPHAVIAADPSELNAQHVIGAIPPSTFLIAEQAVHPSAMASAECRFLFGLGLFPDALFRKFGFAKSSLEAWGSVSTSALDLACRMGANPIIFVGQDFAYSWNRDYASHTIYHGNWFDVKESGTARATDIYGDEAYTTENLIAYRDYFIRRMGREKDTWFINATEGGILTVGAEILTLGETLARYARGPLNIAARLRACFRASKVSTAACGHLHDVLASRDSACGCLDGFLDLVAKEALLHRDHVEIEARIRRGLRAVEATGSAALTRH